MRLRTAGTIAIAGMVLFAAGCRKSAPSQAGTFTTIDWKTAGTIEGTIHYAGTPPKRIVIDMAQDPACAMSGGQNLTEQYLVHNGGLQNVYVWIQSGLGNRTYPTPATPVVVDQKGCRYIPHVIAAMAGQAVKFLNSDPTMHNVHMTPTIAGNQSVDISEGPGAPPESRIFAKPEQMIPVRCNNHPWMEAFLNVAANPFFAVSDADGHFVIKGVPPGTYTLGADQEKLGEKTSTITVQSGKTTQVDFNYSGTGAQ
jgi:Carboxypeptidase regulatory-like domain